MNRRCFEVARVAQEVSQALNFSFQVDKDNGGESLVEFLEELRQFIASLRISCQELKALLDVLLGASSLADLNMNGSFEVAPGHSFD